MSDKRRTRTRDLNTVAASIMRQATGEEPVRRPVRLQDTQDKPEKPEKPKR